MRVAFLGTPPAAVPSLDSLCDAGHEIVLLVTRPDRPVGRSRRPVPPAVKVAAVQRGIEAYQPDRVRGEDFLARLRAASPELLVVVAYGKILPQRVLDLPPSGAVNVHFSLLPAYRGAAPVQWALAHGETATGVTTMRMTAGLDEGDILLQREVPVGDDEHAPSLERRLAAVGAELLLETLERLEQGTLVPRSQDSEAASFAPRIARRDGEVDPSRTADEIRGRIRGFDPWPGVWLSRRGKRLRIVEARPLESRSGGEPGRVEAEGPDGLSLVCGADSRLGLVRIQPEGGRILTARDAKNGRQLLPGDRLERVAGA